MLNSAYFIILRGMKTKRKQRVVVGISGGVDSSVSALLLKEAGYEVSGIFMQNWEADAEDPYCTASQDLSDARAACDRIGISLHTINFAKQYWERVFQHCLDEFKAGLTPNPDILCNQEIKFKAFLDHALNTMGADYLATGHYTALKKTERGFELHKAADLNKDQTYFLYTLTQSILSRCLFPLAHLTKPEVRAKAEKAGLPNHNKKDSTGICFIGERKFKTFLKEYLLAQPGPIQTPDGKEVGQHDGLIFYTLGQRKGLHIGGKKEALEAPWYVVNKNLDTHTLVVAQGHEHPLLYRRELVFTHPTWINDSPSEDHFLYQAKIRYRQADQACTLMPTESPHFRVDFEQPQRAITPGQSIVLYEETRCVGGGIII